MVTAACHGVLMQVAGHYRRAARSTGAGKKGWRIASDYGKFATVGQNMPLQLSGFGVSTGKALSEEPGVHGKCFVFGPASRLSTCIGNPVEPKQQSELPVEDGGFFL